MKWLTICKLIDWCGSSVLTGFFVWWSGTHFSQLYDSFCLPSMRVVFHCNMFLQFAVWLMIHDYLNVLRNPGYMSFLYDVLWSISCKSCVKFIKEVLHVSQTMLLMCCSIPFYLSPVDTVFNIITSAEDNVGGTMVSELKVKKIPGKQQCMSMRHTHKDSFFTYPWFVYPWIRSL